MINWKLRIQNKTTLVTLVLMTISVIYLILDLVGVIPPFPQEKVVKICSIIIDILALLGIVVDPTTSGITDSSRAMTYDKPNNAK